MRDYLRSGVHIHIHFTSRTAEGPADVVGEAPLPHSLDSPSSACADVNIFYLGQEISLDNTANKSGWGTLQLNTPVRSSYLTTDGYLEYSTAI